MQKKDEADLDLSAHVDKVVIESNAFYAWWKKVCPSWEADNEKKLCAYARAAWAESARQARSEEKEESYWKKHYKEEE